MRRFTNSYNPDGAANQALRTPFLRAKSMTTTKRRTYLRCEQLACNRAKLIYRHQGQSFQSDNGFIIVKVTCLYCPRCGGSYGNPEA